MKCQQPENEDARSVPRKTGQQGYDGEGGRPAVHEQMMKLLVIVERDFLARNQTKPDVDRHSKAIGIRNNTSQRHQFSVPRIIGNDGANQPASNKVSDR